MKTLTIHTAKMLAVLIGILALGYGSAMADSGYHREAWSHDHHGYWDDHSAYHPFIFYNGHHGYWRDRDGVRVFINID